MDKKRSKGITLIGSINRTLFGFVTFVASLFILVLSFGEFGKKVASKYSPSLIAFRFEFIYFLMLAIVFIITGDGILKLKEKSRVHTIYLAIFLIVIGLLKIFFFSFSWSDFVYPLVLIVYFTRLKVKEQFR